MSHSHVRIGIDIGGTFTDLVLIDDRTGRITVTKTLTTPGEFARGVMNGLRELLGEAKVAPDEVHTVVHGTTIVTNAVIERKGARTALLTTSGFEDLLFMGRESRYDVYDILIEPPDPLVHRADVRGVLERTLASGEVLRQVDRGQLVTTLSDLKERGIQAVAICLLHSYQNPANEQVVEEVVNREMPGVYTSISSEVSPQIREYPRLSTTIANVYVRPLVQPYLEQLGREMADLGIVRNLFIMLSNGGVATRETAIRFPVRMLESGPSAGVLATTYLSQLLEIDNVVAFDMGGTTAKGTLIEGGTPTMVHEFEAARKYRFKKGSGLPISVPCIEMIEIGAGGGSIARVDSLGLLKVGPESSGSDPGPACYGFGGTHPTVTDANLLLGYLDPDYFLGGHMGLDVEAAARVVGNLANKLGLSVTETAWGIHQVVNENMASAFRMHAIERGKDISGWGMFAFGGAGPMHALNMASSLSLNRVVIPMRASVLSAFGLLTAPISFDFVQTFRRLLDELDWADAASLFQRMSDRGRRMLEEAGVPADEIRFVASIDMRYVGQEHEINIPVDAAAMLRGDGSGIRERFEDEYFRRYSILPQDQRVETFNLRLTVTGPQPEITLPRQESVDSCDLTVAIKRTRPAFFREMGGYVETPVYDRYRLPVGSSLVGPVLVEEKETTVVVPPGWTGCVDQYQNLIFTREVV